MMPKTDITKFKYELDSKFKIIIKNKIDKKIAIIFIEINNNFFE